MASRENSGLHAALIIFVMITVALSITTYFYYRSAEEEGNKRVKIDETLKNSLEKVKDQSEDIKVLLYVLGWETTMSKDELEGTVKGLKAEAPSRKVYDGYKQDMAKWGEGIENPNYRNVSEALLNAIKDKGQQVGTATTQTRKSQADFVSVEAREVAATATHDAARKKSEADLVAQNSKFDADRKKLTDDKAKLQGEKDAIATKLN